jgi:hypothetical protein
MHLRYQKAPISPLKEKILKANIGLATEVAIQKHIIENLTKALRLECKKRQRGKALNLVGEEDNGL